MTPAERFALNTWLCDYPDDLSYDDIITAMTTRKNDDWLHEHIELWEVVETYPYHNVAEYIEDMRERAEQLLKGE